MASSSVARMQIDRNNHGSWRGASMNLTGVRPRIILSPLVTEPSKPESPASDEAKKQETIPERWASEPQSPTSEKARRRGKIAERWASQLEKPASEIARQQPKELEQWASRPESPTLERARQQPKILKERWSSHRSRESSVATAVRQRAHKEELSALSAASEPVTARAASLLHEIETSPMHAAAVAGGGEPGGCDLPVKVRASSLIQMWRVIEAEGTVSPIPHGGGGHLTGFSPIEERNNSLEEDSGWESDLTGVTVESEKEQGGAGRRLVIGTEQRGRMRSGWFGGNHHWLRGRQEIQKLFEKFEHERRRELRSLAEQRHVSGFIHRSRLQTFLRYRSLLRQVPHQDLRPQSTAHELDQLHHGIAILFLRQQFSPRGQQASTAAPTIETKSACHLPLPTNSEVSTSCDLAGLKTNTIYHEEDFERELDGIKSEKYSLASESEYLQESSSESDDLQEVSQHSDVAWGDTSSQDGNIDWERPILCMSSHSEQDGELMDESNNEHDHEVMEADGMCLTSVSPQRDMELHREEMYLDLLETYSDNVEIRELLERRTVSTSLASDFHDRLNKVLLSALQRQRLSNSSTDEEEEHLDISYNHEFCADYQVASSAQVPSSSSSQMFVQHNNECSSFDSTVHTDVVLDMRSDIANIHHEMGELRKLLGSFLQRNAFQYSVQQDVTTVVHPSVSMGSTIYSSEWEPTNKGTCCICHEKQIDSLLYRCGHMCTCFSCAHDMQCGSGRCPVCNAPIVDVVRAYTEALIPN